MEHKSRIACLILLLLILLLLGLIVTSAIAKSLVLCLDTSGSMAIGGRLEAAKKGLVEVIRNAEKGDRIWVLTFDTYARVLGSLSVGENQAKVKQEKQLLIQRIMKVKAQGRWTHLEQPILMGKSILLDSRERGQILIFSDGISDPDPEARVDPVTLERLADLIKPGEGINLYIISFSQDLEQFFKRPIKNQLVVDPQYPQVRGVAIESFSPSQIKRAIEKIQKAPVSRKINKIPKKVVRRNFYVLPIFLLLLSLILGIATIFFKQRKKENSLELSLTIQENGRERSQNLYISEGQKIIVGSRGDVQLSADLAPYVAALCLDKRGLFLYPLDFIKLNGKQIDKKAKLNFGDEILLRNKAKIIIGGPNG